MTDKPPETALDRLRAGLNRRNDPPSPTPVPESSPGPSKPVAAAPPPVEPAPIDEPAPRMPETPLIARDEQPQTGPEPQTVNAARLRAMQETLDRQKVSHRKELLGTRLRTNLVWATIVALMSAVIAAATYLPAFPMQDDWFRGTWPWRAHVWNRYGGAAIWCINEARKTKGPQPFVCQINFTTDGPDCPRPKTRDVTAAYLCPPWETTWPTDPAPRWSADGPPQWSR